MAPNITFACSCLCSNYKSTPVNFPPPSLPFASFFFHLGIPRHVLGPCHKCFGHMMRVRGYVTCYKTLDTYYLACYIPPWYLEHGSLWVQNIIR
jgi:hypothetical protein